MPTTTIPGGLPGTLAEATTLFEASAVARQAFGDAVVDHYVNSAHVEMAAFNKAVTDWERVRGFERFLDLRLSV